MKKKVIVISLITLCASVLIGGFVMMKKEVKQEQLNLQEISNININTNTADVNITLTDDEKMTVTQYSRKTVDKKSAYTSIFDSSSLVIEDHAKEVNWFLGIKGSAGISYELQIPKTYDGSISIHIGSGNVVYTGSENHKFQKLDLAIEEQGNIKMSSLGLLGDSQISTERGDIDIVLNGQTSCTVEGEAASGDMKISDRFNNGDSTLLVNSNQGNLNVK